MREQISIVMPVYNAGRFLREAVRSVIGQTYPNWELFLVDDASTDNSMEIAREMATRDKRITVIPAEKNVGVAGTRNRGIAMAKGRYIALLDSDDIWMPDKLERQLQLLEQKKAQIAYCSYDFIDEESRQIKRPFLVPEETNYGRMLSNSVISCSTVLMDSALFKEHPFNTAFYHEDYVLWMELLNLPGVRAVGDRKVLAHYRLVAGSRSNDKRNAARERWKIYRESLHMGQVSSASAFIRYAVRSVLKYYI